VPSVIDWDGTYPDLEDRMRLAIQLSRENVERETGGPFGAAVFELESGRLVSVGTNLVVADRNSMLHAEIVALMMAESRLDHYSLGAPGLPDHDLVTSCDPCAMCLGAVLWSGVTRIVTGADREDAKRIGFDEGPVKDDSYRYLEERGVRIVRGVLRAEAAAVLNSYHAREGEIYNG
jgi:tRNA(Arg) A34 adenosine deaminase TadA